MLEVAGLSKSYGARRALCGVNLDVAGGEIVALLGRNGAGKTTFVSIVAGLRHADAGRIAIDGIDLALHPRRAQSRLGYAPQETGVYPALSCRDNLRLFAALAGRGRRDAGATIAALAESLGLTALLDRRASTLSGGERRRLHTAIALVGRPALVLLDEPTVGADVQTRAQLLGVVRELTGDGTSVVYSTHYFPEVEELGASVAVLDRGRMLARGTVSDVVGTYATGSIEFTFSGSLPDLSEVAPRDAVTYRGCDVRIETNDPTSTTAAVLARIDPANLRALSISTPSLEAAFLHLTRHATPTESEEEMSRVA